MQFKIITYVVVAILAMTGIHLKFGLPDLTNLFNSDSVNLTKVVDIVEAVDPIKNTQDQINCSLTNYVLDNYRLNKAGVKHEYITLAENAFTQLESNCANGDARQSLEFILENSTPIFRMKDLLTLPIEN